MSDSAAPETLTEADRYERLVTLIAERAEHWEKEALDADASSDSYRGHDTDAAVDLARSANRARSRAKELRSILADDGWAP